MLVEKFGEWIQEQRKKSGLSQRQLAVLINISNTEISRIESGERKRPAPYILKRIAPHIGISYRVLLEIAGYGELFVEKETDLTLDELRKIEEYKSFLLS